MQLRALAREISRYSFVGITAFLLDSGVLVLCKELLFGRLGFFGTAASVGIGFVAGTVYNYFLSGILVFKGTRPAGRRQRCLNFSLFMLIGLIGLALTELFMLAGIKLFGERLYILIKVGAGALVFFWNYGARKALLYR